MARQAGNVVQNNWVRGLITEATGLNFPEDAATDADSVRFDPKGSVSRRLGIDLEGSATTLAYEVSDGVLKEFVWNAVANTGGFTFLVLQKGEAVHFFELDDGDNLSASVHLSDYQAPGAPAIKDTPCSFAGGAGYLFIAHPYCDPVIVRWNNGDQEFEAARVPIRIRDFKGVEDELNITENPTNLSDEHHYNLKNQGWDQQVRVGSVTNDLGTGGANSPSTGTNFFWESLSP
jgi:hypothetical protein